jgi:hypothetical protein
MAETRECEPNEKDISKSYLWPSGLKIHKERKKTRVEEREPRTRAREPKGLPKRGLWGKAKALLLV